MDWRTSMRRRQGIMRSQAADSIGMNELRDELKRTDQAVLRGARQDGDDMHCNLFVGIEWPAERRVVSVTLPDGKTEKLQLSAQMQDGAVLRLRGRAPGGKGDLYLRIFLVS